MSARQAAVATPGRAWKGRAGSASAVWAPLKGCAELAAAAPLGSRRPSTMWALQVKVCSSLGPRLSMYPRPDAAPHATHAPTPRFASAEAATERSRRKPQRQPGGAEAAPPPNPHRRACAQLASWDSLLALLPCRAPLTRHRMLDALLMHRVGAAASWLAGSGGCPQLERCGRPFLLCVLTSFDPRASPGYLPAGSRLVSRSPCLLRCWTGSMPTPPSSASCCCQARERARPGSKLRARGQPGQPGRSKAAPCCGAGVVWQLLPGSWQ